MKPNNFVFIKNSNLRSSFDLLHLRSIEYLNNQLRPQRYVARNYEFNVGLNHRFTVWTYAKNRKKLIGAVHVRKYWKRKIGVVSRRLKVNPVLSRMVFSQVRANTVSTDEYYSFFLSRGYRNRRRWRRWDYDITLDEFFLFFEQYELVPNLSISLSRLSQNINFDSILTFWSASFIHIALQNARYPFWIYGGDYSPLGAFGGFAQVTNHCLEVDSQEPDYWFGAKARGVSVLIDVEKRLEVFVVIFCWGFLFDFKGPRMLEAQFGVGFLSALLLSASFRSDRCLKEDYASEDWIGEDNEGFGDSAPTTNWITQLYLTYLYSWRELKHVWNVFSIDFWKLNPLIFPSKHSKLFTNDLVHLVKDLKRKFLLSVLRGEVSPYVTYSQFLVIESRFFSYNNIARPFIVFLRLIPKIGVFLGSYPKFLLNFFFRITTTSNINTFTINVKLRTFVFNFFYNYAYKYSNYVNILVYLFSKVNIIFYLRVVLIFFFEILGPVKALWCRRLVSLWGIVKWFGFIFFLLICLYLLLHYLALLYLFFFLLVCVMLGIFRLESDNVRADKFSLFEHGFKLINFLYTWIVGVDFLLLLRFLIQPFLVLLTYLSAVVILLSPLSLYVYFCTWGRYLNLMVRCFPFVKLWRYFSPFTLELNTEVGVFEYLCFWLRRNFMGRNSRFRLNTVLALINLVELNWLVLSCIHLFYGAAGWWVMVKSSEFVSQRWREVFEFNSIHNSSTVLSGSFFTAFGVRGLRLLKSFKALFLEVLFFRLAVPFSNVSSTIKRKILGLNSVDFAVILNDLFANVLFLDSWGVFRRTRFSFSDLVVLDVSFFNIWNLLGCIFRTFLFGGVMRSLTICVGSVMAFFVLIRRVFLVLVCTLIYIILIIFMVYLVILTATLLYICGIKAGLSIFLYISLKIIAICLILSVMRRKE